MVDDEPEPRSSASVEPLFTALQDEPRDEEEKRAGTRGPRLGWKLFWAAVVLLALLAIVLNQAF